MEPVDSAWFVGVFDSMAGGWVVLHDLSCAALVVLVYLQEDDCLVRGGCEAVVCDDAVYGCGWEHCLQVGYEVVGG